MRDPTDDGAWFELGSAQRAIWFDLQLARAPAAYQLAQWVRLQGPVDAARARQAIELMMSRHDALRLRVDAELPRQRLEPSTTAPLRVTQLAGAGQGSLEERIAQHLERSLGSHMPLGDAALFDVELVNVAADDWLLLMRVHHLMADEAAGAVCLRHFVDTYNALGAAPAPASAAVVTSSYLPVLHADADYLASPRHRQDLDRARARLRDLPEPFLSDPTPRRETTLPAEETARLHLDAEAHARLLATADALQVTPAVLVLAALLGVLARRHRRDDIVVGMAVHRRDAANRHVVGLLAGMLPLRCAVDAQASWPALARSVASTLRRDLRHHRLPVDLLARELGLSRGGMAALFEVAYSYMPAERGMAELALAGTQVVETRNVLLSASPLSVHAREHAAGEGLSVEIAANLGLLSPVAGAGMAARLAELLRTGLDALSAGSDEPLAAFDALTATERHQVLQSWATQPRAYPGGSLVDGVQAQVQRQPEAVAVIEGERELSYAQLDAQAKRLAQRLIASGVKPEEAVGVALERSSASVIALLGVLRAGGAYLPLDPAYPSARLAHMIEDAGARLVITDAAHRPLLPGGVQAIELDAQAPDANEADLNVAAPHPRQLAYIIYTSGSTGNPKGVGVEHAAAVNLAHARQGHDPLGPGDRVLAAISVGFDVSIGQLLLPLLSGATIVIAPELRTLGAAEFWRLLQSQRVNSVNSVPSFIDAIVDAAPQDLALRRLMLGGEPLTGALVRRIQARLPSTRVVNMYGPTEACIDASCYIARGDEGEGGLPIGRPLPNYKTLVLDERQQPVGIGVAGELYIGGAGLARGYLNQPGLTAERFIADPHGAPGERLYRSGDRARWRADGQLEFLGRGDAQVKIRGHRIELGEIEAALRAHPAVAQAAVLAVRDESSGAARLAAWLVAAPGATPPSAPALREHLAKTLPEVMWPAAFGWIDALPLTVNGKLDTRALPTIDLASARHHIPPQPGTEARLAALWQDLLGVERVGAADDYFELGGDSLLATRLASRVRAEFGVSLPLRTVFEAPALHALARRIGELGPSAHTLAALPPRPLRLPLSFTQERLWFLSQLQPDSSYNIPIIVRLQGRLDEAALEAALRTLVERHEALRTRIAVEDGAPWQHIDAAGAHRLQRRTLGQGDASDLSATLAALAARPFDLEQMQPLAATLLRLGEADHVLAVVIHHAVFDGWSASIFSSEFAALYTAFSQQQANPLPPPAGQFADFALWQRQRDASADIAWWRETLAGAPPRLALPFDRAPRASASRPAGSVPLRLGAEQHRALQACAREHGASLFMLLHAAFAVALWRWGGEADVVIGTVLAQRTRPEFEPAIGCFINTLALRTRIDADEAFGALLERVREADLAAFAHQALPFEQVVDALQPERSLLHTPVFQVMLVLQNTPPLATELPGLRLTPMTPPAVAAKFELSLSLGPAAGDALAGELEYAADVFDAATAARLAQGLTCLLDALPASTAHSVATLPLLHAAERDQVLHAWATQPQVYPGGSLVDGVQAQVQRQPEAVAVIEGERELSYAQLDAQAKRLAQRLIASGVKPEEAVGVALERSSASVIALLGVLRAGGAYLPLDPAYPSARLAHMIEDAGARLVITDAAHRPLLPGGVQAIELDAEAAEDDEANPPALPTLHPRQLAYIIYTSGSTGNPKGVGVEHAAAVNLAHARQGHDPLGPGDRVLAAISVGFDVSIGQLLLPLLSGATIVIAPELRTLGAAEFWRLLQSQHVNSVNSVPSFIDAIVDAAPAELELRRLMLGGEPLTGALVRRIQARLPQTRVVNMYGPTEACIDASCYIAQGDEGEGGLPIGRPLPNYKTLVLDERQQPVGIGVAGELYIGGAGLARGYLNQPGLTAERFIADPHGAPGERLYRSGDRARWRADGQLEFLGRGDAQVKIRGHRIELGEIEAALLRLPGVREAVVLVREDRPGERALVAYCTGPQAVPAQALQAPLVATLPAVMVPTAFVWLDAFPLTQNGKLDRQALPAPDHRPALRQAPLGEVEVRIAAIWAEVLQREVAGRHDNFFELGGHSLLAMVVIERMRRAGLVAEVRAMFDHPTPASLALALKPADAVAMPPQPLVTLAPAELDAITRAAPGGAANVQDLLPLGSLQADMLAQHVAARAAGRGDVNLLPMLLGFDRRGRLRQALAALRWLVARHDALRAAFVWQDLDEPVQVICRQAALPVRALRLDDPARCGRSATEQLRRRALEMRDGPALGQSPPLNVLVAQDPASGRWLALLMLHHIAVDQQSLQQLMLELQSLARGGAARLPGPVPLRAFFEARARGTSAADDEAFFRRRLADMRVPTAVQGLLADMHSDGATVQEHSQPLDAEVARALRQHAARLGLGVAALFHLALAQQLAAGEGRQDVVFATLLRGRLQAGAAGERGVGLFLNALPLRFEVAAMPADDAARRMHAALAELLPHEQASLAQVRRCSGLPEGVPLMSALLNYRYSPGRGSEPEIGFPGVELLFSHDRSHYPLEIDIDDLGDDFRIAAQACAPLDATRLLQQFSMMLAQLAQALDGAGQAPPLSAAELQRPRAPA